MTEPLQAPEGDELARGTAEAVARRSYGKLVALLAAHAGDIAAAEDALADAFVAALEAWPRSGCPDNPEAWLLSVARRKVIDLARRRQGRGREVALDPNAIPSTWLDPATAVDAIPEHRLGLMFACAHPALDPGVRAPLILQAVLGLSAARIASAMLTSPATMSQRLVRAKTKIREAGIPLQVPGRDDLAGRLATVLDAIYAAFAEGWTDPGGTDVARRDLAEESLFLGHLLAELLPDESEALGLLAFMLHAESRRRARRSAQGDYIPLAEQDTALWDHAMIGRAEELLLRASRLNRIGRFQLEAALQSAHVHRRRSGQPNWPAIVQLYDGLMALSDSPVIAVNRALAVAEAFGPQSGLDELEAVAPDPRLNQYQPYWATRAELLARNGVIHEARRSYALAIGLERDDAVRRFLQARLSSL